MSNVKFAARTSVPPSISPTKGRYSSDHTAVYQLRNQVAGKVGSNIDHSILPHCFRRKYSLSESSSDSSQSIQPKRRKRSVNSETIFYLKTGKSSLRVKRQVAPIQPMFEIFTRSKGAVGRTTTPINVHNARAEHTNHNQMKCLKEETQLIDIQDPQNSNPHRISESHTRIAKKRKKKVGKINKTKGEQNRWKVDEQSNNEFYLYCLIYLYHFSLLEKYRNDQRIPLDERNRLNSNLDEIQKATSNMDLFKDDATLADFISIVYNKNILDLDEQELLEYSLNHEYLSDEIAQLSEEIDLPDEKHIFEAIQGLNSGSEKNKFEELFRRVYKDSPYFTVKKSGAVDSNSLRAQIDDFLTNKANNWDFHEKQLSDGDIKIIVKELKMNKSCTNLDLRHNKITALGARYLANMLSVNHTLKALLLSHNNIGDIGLQYLCNAMVNPMNSLEQLYLNKNGITEVGAKALADMLKHNTSLTDLSLNYNRIGNDGVRALCDVLKTDNTTLKYLCLHGNEINDSGIKIIVEMVELHSALKQINLGDNHISTQCKQQLEDATKKHNVALDLFF